MITKMNKLTLLIYHKEYTAFLERLREIGVVPRRAQRDAPNLHFFHLLQPSFRAD